MLMQDAQLLFGRDVGPQLHSCARGFKMVTPSRHQCIASLVRISAELLCEVMLS